MEGNCLGHYAVLEHGSNQAAEPIVRAALSTDAPAIQQLVNGIFGEYGLALIVDGLDEHLAEPAEYFHARDGQF